ncbi:MAG: 3-phosphoshikimate 1-carboxyvinyltransferase [Clostridia bacterium]|nr:3-phosphoshikimate 1-carboxyvinyltransferase [Clostridia bacterium]
MNVRVYPSQLNGELNIPASKSLAHRLLIAQAFLNPEISLDFELKSEDLQATQSCINAIKNAGLLDCKESGTSLRFMLPIASALLDEFEITGSESLKDRPLEPLIEAMEDNGLEFSSHQLPIKVRGKLKAGKYQVPGNISSQFVSGLLFAKAIAHIPMDIEIIGELESKDYVDMTDGVISGQIKEIEGDWTQAANYVVANSLGAQIQCCGLNENSIQGDRRILEYINKSEIDLSNNPDLAPILSVLALSRKGKTSLNHINRLRFKESNRVKAIIELCEAFGGQTIEYEDRLEIIGNGHFEPCTVNGYNDHRIVMAAAIGASFAQGSVDIIGAEAVNKSYPDFWEDYKTIGGRFTCLD